MQVVARLAGSRPARRGARQVFSVVTLVVLAVALLSAGPAAAQPQGRAGGEVFGPATRSAAPTSPAAAAAVPAGFADNLAFGGLSFPTAIAFAPGGKVFVGEKSGIVKVFDSPSDTTATQVVDLRTQVYDVWDRGLLGLAVDPGFGSAGRNFVYVLYTHDHNPLGNPPSWGDGCPTPPGINDDGCTVTGNLSRVPVNPTTGVASGPEQPLITDEWCQQYPSHSIGHLDFGPDGNLYVTGGDGASFNNADWGQFGTAGTPTPPNPCGDPSTPPVPVGMPLSPPGAEGGALRSQSPRRPAGPILLSGAVLRVDPATGNGVAGNPMYNSQSPASNASRIIGYGLRNPFRFTFRPGTPELWIGDVGWGTWEEVNRMASPTPSTAVNFGWPCYEGAGRMSNYDAANLTICENLYAANTAAGPYYTYNHSASVVSGDGCSLSNGSVISAISFYRGGGYPGRYNGALFFGDHSRSCIWAMLPGGNGLPNSNNLQAFVVGGSNPVDLAADPATGDLFYANFEGGQIRRIQFVGANNPPNAVATANPTSGPAPLTVQFNGSGSSDPDGDAISYSWDLNGDGVYGDSTQANPSFTYTTAATYSVTLRVTDARGASSVSAPITITVGGGNSAPTPVIDTPPSSLTYAVGDTVSFSGHATDAQDGTLPDSALSWRIIIHHGGHTHPPIATFDGVASGSFSAPDHDYPSFLELQLTATDSGGTQATTSVNIQPRTVNLTFQSNPSGLQLVAGPTTGRAPFTITAVVNARIQLIATSPQKYRGKNYGFVSWSDGGPQAHLITTTSTPTTYTATYQRLPR
jgi:glucose/arabinose dehydrogenase